MKEECKICGGEEDDTKESLLDEEIEIEINAISNEGDDCEAFFFGKKRLGFSLLLFGDSIGFVVDSGGKEEFYKSIPVNYCPMCGRELPRYLQDYEAIDYVCEDEEEGSEKE